jgi:hypothetical protein
MRRAFIIAALAELLLVIVLLYSDIKEFLWTHPWWQSFLAGLPAISLSILAWLELRHSAEANALRAEANTRREEANSISIEANDLQAQIVKLTAELNEERNKHLEQIAKNTEKPRTQAQRNADILRKHRRANVWVSEGQGGWSNTPEIVEVSDDNIVTLFSPKGFNSSIAWCVQVDCGDLQISEFPKGGCPLQIKVLKRYGNDVQLGEIKRWEDRHKAQT